MIYINSIICREYTITYYLSFGVRKMYMKKGLIFNLNIQDMLRSTVYRTEDMGQQPGYESWTRNSVRQQRVMFSITWMFGQQQRTKYRKVGDLEELNRLGGGGGVQAGQ